MPILFLIKLWNIIFQYTPNCQEISGPQPSPLFEIFSVVVLFDFLDETHLSIGIGLFQINSKQVRVVDRYTFLKPPPLSGNFRFVTLPLEILEKTSFHSWKSCKIACHNFEIGNFKVKNQDPRKFHVSFSLKPPEIFNWILGFSRALSSIPLEWKFHVLNP